MFIKPKNIGNGSFHPRAKPQYWPASPASVSANCDKLGLPIPSLLCGAWVGPEKYENSRAINIMNPATEILVGNSRMWEFQGIGVNENNEVVRINNVVDYLKNNGTYFLCSYFQSTPATARYFGITTGAQDFQVYWLTGGSKLRFAISGDIASVNTVSINNDETHAIIATWDESAPFRKIYIDGKAELDDSASFTFPTFTIDAFNIGLPSSNDRHIGGIVLCIGTWDEILDETQVRTLTYEWHKLLEPTPTRIFFDVGAAAADLTANLADTNAANWSDTRAGTLTYAATVADDVNT